MRACCTDCCDAILLSTQCARPKGFFLLLLLLRHMVSRRRRRRSRRRPFGRQPWRLPKWGLSPQTHCPTLRAKRHTRCWTNVAKIRRRKSIRGSLPLLFPCGIFAALFSLVPFMPLSFIPLFLFPTIGQKEKGRVRLLSSPRFFVCKMSLHSSPFPFMTYGNTSQIPPPPLPTCVEGGTILFCARAP